MKINKILAALLALIMLAALAACGSGDTDSKQADNEFKFMQSDNGKIRQADVDCLIVRMDEVNDVDSEVQSEAKDALAALAVMRAELWEAEELDLAISWAEAREWAEQYYAALPNSVAQSEDGQTIWDWTQGYLERTQMTEEDYLDYLAFNRQVVLAGLALQDKFMADVPSEEHHTEAIYEAFGEYTKGLVEKYHDYLVEDDLLPLLDEVLESM